MDEKLVKIIERALSKAAIEPRDDGDFGYRHDAIAALSALGAAGYAMVPVEPTEAMINASQCECGSGKENAKYIRHDFRRMIAAAKEAGDE